MPLKANFTSALTCNKDFMSHRVFVLNPDRTPLMPCTPKRARKLLEAGRAAAFRQYPFTLILKNPSHTSSQPLALKIDPGSQVTGLALVLEGKTGRQCIWGAELAHRGNAIKLSLLARRGRRSSRRSRKLRHRPARFLNRTRPAEWLPPSLMHRVLTITSWAKRLDRFTLMDSISIERVSFDTQRIMNADISGVAYQKGTLYGNETRAYLRQKWNGDCAYCGKKGEEVEHLLPRSRGGTNRISNLVWSCRKCNEKKGTLTLEEFLKRKPAVLKKIQDQQQVGLQDAAAVNATKERLLEELTTFGYPVETGSGVETHLNRTSQHYEKAHWIDAACVGSSGAQVSIHPLKPLKIKSMGRGTRQMCGLNRFGFPIRHRTRQKVVFGFQTGDMVRAIVTTGTKIGTYTGRVTVRTSGSFRMPEADGLHHRFFTIIQKGDGYGYSF